MEHVRLAVYLHLQIMVPLVPILVSEAVAFNAVQFIRHLFRLTASKVVHGLDHCPGLFDLVFDLLCWVSDEVGVVTEVKSTLSATQKELQQQLVLPAVYVDRVSRLFHFQPRYALYENLLLVTDLVSTTQVSNTSTAVSGGAVSVGPGTSSGAAALSSSCSNTVTAAVSTSASAAVVGNNTITSSVFTPTASVSNVHQSNVYFKPWELLEDWSDSSSTSTATTVTGGVGGGGNPLVSNTPLSLSLFGAVRVPTSFDVVNGQCNSSYRDLLGSSGWRPLKIVAETGVVPQQASATLSSKGSPIKTPFSPMAVDTPQATTQQIEMHLVASATSSNSLKRARE